MEGTPYRLVNVVLSAVIGLRPEDTKSVLEQEEMGTAVIVLRSLIATMPDDEILCVCGNEEEGKGGTAVVGTSSLSCFRGAMDSMIGGSLDDTYSRKSSRSQLAES